MQVIDTLYGLNWVDAATRVIILEFTLLSPQSGMVCPVRMVVEVHPSGFAFPIIFKEAFRADVYDSFAGRGRIALDFFFVLSAIGFFIADMYSSFSTSLSNGGAKWYRCEP